VRVQPCVGVAVVEMSSPKAFLFSRLGPFSVPDFPMRVTLAHLRPFRCSRLCPGPIFLIILSLGRFFEHADFIEL